MNRRGTLMDAFPALVSVFLFAMTCVVVVYFIGTFNTAMQASDVSQDAKDLTDNWNDQVPWVFDFLIVMLMVALPIVSLILAFFNNIHPLLYWASMGLSLILVIVGSSIGEAWNAVTDTGTLTSSASNLPMTDWILSHFALYAIFCIIVIGYGVFVKTRNAGGYF